MIAPFASFPAAGKTDFRKFFIIPANSPKMEKVEVIVMDRLPRFASKMEEKFGLVPFVQAIKRVTKEGYKTGQIISGAPYLIIACERKGIPAIASESLSYCMQTMWLKATSLKIGFRPVTFILHLKLGLMTNFANYYQFQLESMLLMAAPWDIHQINSNHAT